MTKLLKKNIMICSDLKQKISESRGTFALILSLPALFTNTEEENFEFDFPWNDISPRVHGLNFKKALHVTGTCLRIDEKRLMVKGTIETEMLVPCDRCLKETSVMMDLPFEAQYVRGIEPIPGDNFSDDDEIYEEIYFFQGDDIDLAAMIQDEILLNLPSQVLCKDNCKGLCPVCGIDRNENICMCNEKAKEDRPDSPLKALEALIIDDEEV